MLINDKLPSTKIPPFITAEYAECDSFLRIAICDDEEDHVVELHQLLSSVSTTVDLEIHSYTSAEVLLKTLENQKDLGQPLPDAIFCDIKMPGMDGIDFGKEIQSLCHDIYFILFTAYAEYAVQGYETRAFRYLLKPVSASDIEQVLFTIIQERSKRKKLIAWTGEKEEVIALSDIIYLSSEDKYTILYTKNNHYVDRSTLNEYEQLLAPYGFFRIHRKYIVNLAYHKSMSKGTIFLLDGTTLSISRRRESSYRKALLKHLEKELL